MLEIRQINKNEELSCSAMLEIKCTYKDLMHLRASLNAAILYNDDVCEESLVKAFKKLEKDILNFRYPD